MQVSYCIDEKITPEASLFIFIKLYVIHKIQTLSRAKSVWCDNIHGSIVQHIKRSETFNELTRLLQAPLQCCYSGLKVYFVPLMKLYQYVCTLNIEALSQLSDDDIHDFLFLETSGLSDATLRNYRSVMVNFFKFIQAKAIDGTSDKHPISKVLPQNYSPNLTTNESRKEYITHFDRLKLFHAISSVKFRKQYVYRNRLMLLMMFLTGMKPSEITRLRMCDIRLKGLYYEISVCSSRKSNQRINYIAKHFIHHDYSYHCKMQHVHNCDDYLFRKKNGKQLNDNDVQQVVAKVISISNIRTHSKGSMVFRKLYVNHVYNKTKDIVLLQEQLGYRNIQSVQNLIIDLDRAKKIADSAC